MTKNHTVLRLRDGNPGSTMNMSSERERRADSAQTTVILEHSFGLPGERVGVQEDVAILNSAVETEPSNQP